MESSEPKGQCGKAALLDLARTVQAEGTVNRSGDRRCQTSGCEPRQREKWDYGFVLASASAG